jgi:hypothetical protein
VKPSRANQLAVAAPVPGPEPAYFFDIDGTLLDIAASPDGVRLDREFRHVIEGLYHASGGAVALISGRAISDIDRLFPELQWPVAGQHGLERRDAEGRVFHHAAGWPSWWPATPICWWKTRGSRSRSITAGRPGWAASPTGSCARCRPAWAMAIVS